MSMPGVQRSPFAGLTGFPTKRPDTPRKGGVWRAGPDSVRTVVPMTRALLLPATCPVAGVSFRQAVLRQVVEGDQVLVVAATDNPHDPYACEVRTRRGDILGFVPRALAHRLRARGTGPWVGLVQEVLRGETWGLRVRIENEHVELDEVTVPAGERASGGQVPGRDLSAPAGGDRRRVRAISGRDLGVLIGRDGDTVIVDNDGTESSYPASVVTIEG